MEITGKTIWITGASSGIGRALALALAAEGAVLILSGRNETALADVSAACPGSTVIAFDATDLDALPAMVSKAQAVTGHIDMLVNNAGIGARGLARDTQFDVYRRVMEIDYFAPLRLTQLVLPAMRVRGSGHLAVVSSISGKFGNPGATAYCSAKFALIGYFDALRSEVAHEGIAVTVITPGFVKTAIALHSLDPNGNPHGAPSSPVDRGITADEAAQQIVAGFRAGTREIPVGRGPEMAALELVRSNPEQLFDMMAAMGAQMASAG
jgi:dehydrogenase/reductase SDR family protein 7B